MNKKIASFVHLYMDRAIEISEKGGRNVYPNPMVGAVIFNDDGELISQAWHEAYGKDHAELAALKKIDFKADGLSMAVSLEPCSHHGKTPPCTDAIIRSGIKNVYIAAVEPTDEACQGAEKLLSENISVTFLSQYEDRVKDINRYFFKTAKTGTPWVTLKVATSMDGFISILPPQRTKITGNEANRYAHMLRSEMMGIVVGANTVNIDNPLLTVRHVEGVSPRPVIYSMELRLNKDRNLIEHSPIIFTCSEKKEDIEYFRSKGCDVEVILSRKLFIEDSLSLLWSKYKINSILVEGGGKLHYSFLNSGEVDEICHVQAPFPICEGSPMFDGKGFTSIENVPRFHRILTKSLGGDLLSVYRKSNK